MDVAFIIVFGTRWHYRTVANGWDGILNCPSCKQPRRMVEKHAFKAFTLYWMPLFRTEDGGHLVECTHCDNRFDVPAEVRAAQGRPPDPRPDGHAVALS